MKTKNVLMRIFLALIAGICLNSAGYGQIRNLPSHVKDPPSQPSSHYYEPRLIPYTLELNGVGPTGSYDQGRNIWVQTYTSGRLTFRYTLKNKINTKAGRIVANINGNPLSPAYNNSNTIGIIPYNANFSGEFYANNISPGSYTVNFAYMATARRINPHTYKLETYDSTAADMSFNFLVNAPSIVDNDHDGMDDNLEHTLLEKYRPYYLFSKNGNDQDDYRPMDIRTYLTLSELLTSGNEDNSPVIGNNILMNNPYAILNANFPGYDQSDITKKATKSSYHINPMEKPHNLTGNPGRHGFDWKDVLQYRNIGLYGHVVPISIVNVKSNDFLSKNAQGESVISLNSKQGTLYYKVEYWQFFGFNDVAGIAGDHEGDWCTVQIIVETTHLKPVKILYFAHGDYITFNIDPNASQPTNGNIQELRGENFNTGFIDLNIKGSIVNNMVRFYQDEVTKQFTHPMVYIEIGSHEFWPSQYGWFPVAGNHDGNGYQFLTKTPPNLGEVEGPFTNETDEANVILKFNGYWGAYGGYPGSPPEAPILHGQWTWPQSSSIRWQITKNGFGF